jgi:deazaflavin-dependent oxidoreductase (nitroreductase family)
MVARASVAFVVELEVKGDMRAPYQAICRPCKSPRGTAGDASARTLPCGPMPEHRYVAPGLGTRLFNLVPMGLARLGVSVWGSRTLAVRGRSSGEWRTVPVNLLEHAGVRYLVAPRGETHWVRNLRAAGSGELRLGPRREIFHAREIADADKPPILRAYLRKWAFEVNQFFQGVGADAAEADLQRIAPGYPVFRIE